MASSEVAARTSTVLAHVQVERLLQADWDDSGKDDTAWNDLLSVWLAKVRMESGTHGDPDTRYVRLIQLAALAVAAAEARRR